MRVVVADDSWLLREGLAYLPDELGHCVVATVDDATSVLPAVIEHEPDVAIVDVRMPPTFTDDGMRAAVAVRRERPATAVLILSQYVETSYAGELLASGEGRVGYLLKDRVQELDVLRRALDTVVGVDRSSTLRSWPASWPEDAREPDSAACRRGSSRSWR